MKYADAMIQHESLDHVEVERLIVNAKGESNKPEMFNLAAREAILLSMLHWANVELHVGEQAWNFKFNDMLMIGELVGSEESSIHARPVRE